jgi:hypothetical protein
MIEVKDLSRASYDLRLSSLKSWVSMSQANAMYGIQRGGGETFVVSGMPYRSKDRVDLQRIQGVSRCRAISCPIGV